LILGKRGVLDHLKLASLWN